MKNAIISIIFIISLCSFQSIVAQKIIVKYDKRNPTAKVLLEEVSKKTLYEQKLNNKLKKDPEVYPITGSYSPTAYSNAYIGKNGVGFSNYVYVPTYGKLKPGKQYTIKIRMKFDESYDEMPFFQKHFGVALTSNLYSNKFPSHWGLWSHTFESIGIFEGGREVTIEQDFRPLCMSKYLVLGVFKGEAKDSLNCFYCYYNYEFYEISISETDNPDRACIYFCDEFKSTLEYKNERTRFDIYFDSGSHHLLPTYEAILDSIADRLTSSQDIILLSGHTDISGTDNETLATLRITSVKGGLIARGIDHRRIKGFNYADDQSATTVLNTDRRVQIDLMKGVEYKQLYSDMLDASKRLDFPKAHSIMTKDWIEAVPPNIALSAYFDDWGNSPKSKIFKDQLLKTIKEKVYNNRTLVFTLDSLKYEWLKGRSLSGHLVYLRLPGTEHTTSFSLEKQRSLHLQAMADEIYRKNGFPQKAEVGLRASRVLPDIVLSSQDIIYLKKYLPLFLSACEQRKLPWSYYARLYDQIKILQSGFQKYGTHIYWKEGQPIPEFPFEDIHLVNQFRREVKLAPFTKTQHQLLLTQHLSIDKVLVSELYEIYVADQYHRNTIDENIDLKKCAETDSINQIKVKQILDERGWLGPDIVGKKGNEALFLVIQHANLDMQLKYLPMMKDAVKDGRADVRDFAFLQDRVALKQGGKQIYGSQILKDPNKHHYYVAPLIDPNNVNERRLKIGLIAMGEYVKKWDIDWETEVKMVNKR